MQEHNTVIVGLGRTAAWVATMVHDHGRVRRGVKGAKYDVTERGAAGDECGQRGARYSGQGMAWLGRTLAEQGRGSIL
jgi:prephenate dehydrogenase